MDAVKLMEMELQRRNREDEMEMSVAELRKMTRRLVDDFCLLENYTFQVSEIRDEIRIVGGEILGIIMDVDGLKGQIANLEDFLEWKRELEGKLKTCQTLATKIIQTDFSGEMDEDGEADEDDAKSIEILLASDRPARWVMKRLMKVADGLIDYFAYILLEDFHGETRQEVRSSRLYAAMLDGDREVWDTFGRVSPTEVVTTEEVAEKFLELHELVGEIEAEIA